MSRGSYSTTPMSLRIAAITCASRGVLFAAVDAILSQWPIEKLQPENQRQERYLKVGMEKADDAAGHSEVLANVADSFICIQVFACCCCSVSQLSTQGGNCIFNMVRGLRV